MDQFWNFSVGVQFFGSASWCKKKKNLFRHTPCNKFSDELIEEIKCESWPLTFTFYSRSELQKHLYTTRSPWGTKQQQNDRTFAVQKFPKPTLKWTNVCEERKRRDRTLTETANLLFSAQGLFVHMAAALIAELGREKWGLLFF